MARAKRAKTSPDRQGAGLPAAAPAQAGQATTAELFALAVAHHQAGRLAEAEILYQKIILSRPSHAEAWSNLSLALIARGESVEAVRACVTAIALRPDYAEAHLNLIEALTSAGRYAEAAVVYANAIRLMPARPDLRANLGTVLEALGRPDEALDAFAGALALQPDFTLACLPAARLLSTLGRLDEAVAVFEAAIRVRPDFVEALSNLGTVLNAQGRFAEAVGVSGRAFAQRPDNAEIAGNFGVALQQTGRTADAEQVYRHAIALNPNLPGPHANRGVALQELLRFDEAVEAFDRAIALKPDFATAIVEAIKVRRHICDWSRYEEDRATLYRLLDEQRDVIFMLLLMTFETTPAQQHACARQSMVKLNAVAAPARAAPNPAADGRIRVGYLSHDYREHPVGRLLPDLFARHDRARFEVTAYSIGKDDPGPVRQRIREGVEQFVDLQPLSDRAAADRIAADGIDILLDLTGPTIGSRQPILTLRPAPVQVSFLGWPGTMGLDAIDYVIADRFLVRDGEEVSYSEKVVRLPDCYQPSDGQRGNAGLPVTREHCGLPPDAFVFCSFNNTSKITPTMFACWMRLLAAVPGSILWLYCKTPQTIANLTASAAAHGIGAERLIFAGFAATDLYLSRYRVADLFLDSVPYNAGATCNDALFAGLPVLTCAGDSYVGRMAGSMLTALGLPELVTSSLTDYEAVALDLARRPRKLAALKRKLAGAAKTAPLFDMARYVGGLEAAFDAIHRRQSEGLAPDHLDIAAAE